MKEDGDTNFILDCSIDVTDDIMKQAQQVGLMGSDHSFIVPNLVIVPRFTAKAVEFVTYSRLSIR